MDFTIFDHKEHMTALTWLGRKDWMIFQDIPAQRAISARPRKLTFQKTPTDYIEGNLCVGQSEFNKYPKEMWNVLEQIMDVLEFDVVGTLWYNTLAKALAGGPKIFRPTTDQCEALQHAEARYSFKDYKQPFPVIILEIPNQYRQSLKEQYGIDDTPHFVLVNHDDKNNFITVSAFYNKGNIITHITPDRAEYETIEDSLIKNRGRVEGNTAEFDAAENVQRLGVNFAMMMSLYSVKVINPTDNKNYKIWKEEAKATRKGGVPTHRAIEAQQNLAALMHELQFNQHVEFFDEIEEQVEVAQGVDIDKLHKSPRSHWRRGHFAMQPCGIGRRERKMIFRKPVLIRAKYFLGDVKDTTATYTIHAGRGQLQPPPIIDAVVETNLPPELKIGQKIEVTQTEENPVPIGTIGEIIKIISLGSNIQQIDARSEDGQRFSLIVPPDDFKFA